ncbi:hypothetical protein D2E80_11980 [Mycobacteroides abscessus]|nr:hypothetical protein D2E80_11980 [Mycobacteroides abscessus]
MGAGRLHELGDQVQAAAMSDNVEELVIEPRRGSATAWFVFGFMGILGGLGALVATSWDAHEYRLGTPVTATVTRCDVHRGETDTVTCYGTWAVDGVQQSGFISGCFDGDMQAHEGRQVDIHVRDDHPPFGPPRHTGYTADSVGANFWLGLTLGPTIIVLGVAMVLAGRRELRSPPPLLRLNIDGFEWKGRTVRWADVDSFTRIDGGEGLNQVGVKYTWEAADAGRDKPRRIPECFDTGDRKLVGILNEWLVRYGRSHG